METQSFSFSDILPVIKKHFKLLMILGALAAVLAAVFSMPTFIKPRYTSMGVYYPSNISSYAKESRTEQLLQLFESSAIRDSLIAKFDLYKKFEIEPNGAGAKHGMTMMLSERISVSKNRYEAVEIKVQDESPDTAYLMVQELVKQCNLLTRRLQREKSQEVFDMRTAQLAEQKRVAALLDKQLKDLSKGYGILELESQTQEITQGLYRLLASGKSENSAAVKQANALLEALKEKGAEYQTLYLLKEFVVEFLGEVEVGYQRAYNDIHKELTYTNEIVAPVIPDKKSYPVRWIIVFTAVFITELFAVIVFLIADAQKRRA
tara:strand:- start:189459 stop:190418 length:960 start_codon:yes stop_codon:yes gene_type:complete